MPRIYPHVAPRRSAVLSLCRKKTVSEISETLGLSRSLVQADVKALRRDGKIRPISKTELRRRRGKGGAIAGKLPRTHRWQSRLSQSMRGNTSCLGRRHSKKTIQLIRDSRLGSDNPNWRGGSGTEVARRVRTRRWKQFRLRVLERDRYTCVGCRMKFPSRNLSVHHKIPQRLRSDLVFSMRNCESRCLPCHKKADDAFRRKERHRAMGC